MTDIPVTIRLRADGKGLTGTLDLTGRELRKLEGQLDRTGRSTDRFNRKTQGARQRLSGLATAARAAFAALAVRQVANMADQMTLLNSRLRLVTDSQEKFNTARASINRIATENGAALGSVTELYTRLAQSSADLRDNQEELDTITQAITQSMRVSGTSTTESAGAIRQLSQAFASGVLRGDEFNSVNEQAPRLMQALADSLGVTRGELRGLAEDGLLTSEILREALVDQAGNIADEAAQIPQTMGQAINVLQNRLLQFVSAIDSATGGSGSVASFINRISEQVGAAADSISSNTLRIRLAGIAMVRGLLLIFEDLRGGITLLVDLASLRFDQLVNAIQGTIAKTADLIARYIEMNAAAVDLVPGLGGVADSQLEIAANFRLTAQEARGNIRETKSYSETITEARERVGQAKDQIRQITDDMADSAIATAAAADSNDELNGSLRETPAAAEPAADSIDRMSEAALEFEERLFALRRELAGPLQNAQAEYQRDTAEMFQLFATGQITFDQFGEGLDLLTERFEIARDEIGNRMARTLEDLAFNTLPAAIRQMLGLADATGDVARESGALSRIGSNFAQSVIHGNGVRDSLGNALVGFGGQGIADALDQTDMAQFFKTAFKDGIGEAFKDSEFQKNSAAGYALALGQAMEGNYGQAALTAAGNAFGGELGAMIGSIVGDMLFGDSVPKFQARGTRATSGTDAGTDLTLDTAFGDFQLAFRKLSDSQKQAVEEGYREFFNFLGDLTSNLAADQQRRVADAVQEFGISSRSGPDSPEGQMKLLLEDIVATFPPFFGELVNAEATLDARLGRLADLLNLQGIISTGRGLGGLGFEDLALLLDDVAMSGETLTDALERVRTGFDSLTQLGLLTGNALADTTEGLARLSASLTRLYGGDAGALSGRLDRIFEAFFSDEEQIEATIATASQTGARILQELLAGISGVDFNANQLTQEGFRGLLDLLTGPGFDLSDEQLAQLFEAGNSIADLIDAESELARIRGESVEDLAEDWRRAAQSIRDVLDNQLLGISNLTPQQRLNEAERQLREAVAAAPDDLDAARSIPRLFQQAIAEGAAFYGTAGSGFDEFQAELRGLLESLELGPEAVPVAEAQLGALNALSGKATMQLDVLEDIRDTLAGNASGGYVPQPKMTQAQPGDIVVPGQGALLEADSRVLSALADISANIAQGNQDRRRATQAQLEELEQAVDELRKNNQARSSNRIDRSSTDASRPAVIRGRNT